MKSITVLRRLACWCAAVCLTMGTASMSNAQLLVDLDVSNYDPVSGIWADTAGLGNFTAAGSPTIATTPQGVSGIRFDGVNHFFTGPAAPEGLTGLNPTRSIEVWALNPAVASEETLVAWGRRGGGDGSNMSFNYGNHQNYGAVGHWGAPDLGWNFDNATVTSPAPLEWHHLVYTFDGNETKVYNDGFLMGSEVVGTGIINTHAVDTNSVGLPIRIGSQNEANGTATGGLRFSGLVSKVRVWDNVLTPEEVLLNWASEDGLFPDPTTTVVTPTPMPLSNGPIHRWSFSEDIATTGGIVIDSVGDAHGLVLGDGATSNGGAVSLPGGPSATAPYIDLPNNLISVHNEVTLEGWFTNDQVQAWGRVFDFGSSQAGEPAGPGGAGEGIDYLILSATVGTDTNVQRLEFNNRDTGGQATYDAPTNTGAASDIAVGEEYHFAVVWDKATDLFGDPTTKIKLYRNGEFVGEAESTTAELSQINDVNNWLGRSNWTGDNNVAGSYNEFRIYDRALSADEILGNFQSGANTINVVPEPAMFSLGALSLLGLLAARRRK